MMIRMACDSDIDEIVDMAHEFETHLMTIDNTFITEVPPKEHFRAVLLQGFTQNLMYEVCLEDNE